MSLVNRKGAADLRSKVVAYRGDERARTLERDILLHFDSIHSQDYRTDNEIERALIADELNDLDRNFDDLGFIKGLITFAPSSASKCERELAFKAYKVAKDETPTIPYQKRWTRNATAVHRATQRDLLYGEKILPYPKFKVRRGEDGRPCWERNIQTVKRFEHNGVEFQIFGMMDGQLIYTPDDSVIGFEFKTKSTTLAAIGEYKMKEASPDHRLQCVAYSLLFGLDEFLIVYESLAKDSWSKGKDAKPDMRAFHVRVTEDDRLWLLDKFARVAEQYYNGEIPRPDYSKCMFCPFKTRCEEVGS
jgi:hypothetical protein